MTPLQEKMIFAIAESDYNTANGKPESASETLTYLDMVVETQQDKGVAVSLVNVGLIGMSPECKGDGGSIWLTEPGFSEYRKLKSA
jgi:hypothetical protein